MVYSVSQRIISPQLILDNCAAQDPILAGMLLVLADDLTGALDTGVQFAGRGIRVVVSTAPAEGLRDIWKQEVLVMDLETRHLAPHEAAERIRRIAAHSRKKGYTHWYKKTDSTLRGNIGAELAALLEVSESGPLMFIPAYPQTGRITKYGIHYVHGTPVHESSFGRDPLNPLRGSYVPALIAEQTEVPVEVTDGMIFRADDYPSGSQRIVVFDAETEEDLQHIGLRLQEAGQLSVTAGCAGFAAVLADLLKLPSRSRIQVPCPSQLLVVCGSINPVSLIQTTHAAERGFVGYSLSQEQLLGSCGEGAKREEELIRGIRTAVGGGKDVVLSASTSAEQAESRLRAAKEAGLDRDSLGLRVVASLSRVVVKLGDLIPGVTLMVIGGDATLGIIQGLQTDRLQPLKEIRPGVVLSRLLWRDQEIPLISKAGGFGEEDILLQIKQYLTGAGTC